MRRALRKILPGVLLSLLALTCFATDTDEIDIKANFTNYWNAMARSDFKSASVYVHPLDLAQLRTELLPAFLQAGESGSEKVAELMSMFFGEIPPEQRSRLSGPELFSLFSKFALQMYPQAQEVLGEANRSILEIKLDGPTQSTVRYSISNADKSVELTDTLGKLNGRWYMRMRISPKETADKMRAAMGGRPGR